MNNQEGKKQNGDCQCDKEKHCYEKSEDWMQAVKEPRDAVDVFIARKIGLLMEVEHVV